MSKPSKVCGELASVSLVFTAVGLVLAEPAFAARLDLYNPNKRYADEKKVIADPASRCNTPEMRKMRDQAVQQVKNYAIKYDIKQDSIGVAKDALDEYLNGISIAWEAMEQPYCGFGAFGTSAVRKSFQKSLNRLQSNFLARIKGTAAANKAQSEVARAIKTSAVIGEETVAAEIEKSLKIEKTEVVAKKLKAKLMSKLEKGDKSNEVRLMQEMLSTDKQIYPEAIVTGYFGGLTEKAVIRFQLKHKIIKSADEDGAGLIGPKTRAIMNKALAE